MTTLVIPKNLAKKGELMLVARTTWEQLRTQLEELRHALKMVSRGEHEIKSGKTIRAASISAALKQYGRKKAH